jgi:hypothetical protein
VTTAWRVLRDRDHLEVLIHIDLHWDSIVLRPDDVGRIAMTSIESPSPAERSFLQRRTVAMLERNRDPAPKPALRVLCDRCGDNRTLARLFRTAAAGLLYEARLDVLEARERLPVVPAAARVPQVPRVQVSPIGARAGRAPRYYQVLLLDFPERLQPGSRLQSWPAVCQCPRHGIAELNRPQLRAALAAGKPLRVSTSWR